MLGKLVIPPTNHVNHDPNKRASCRILKAEHRWLCFGLALCLVAAVGGCLFLSLATFSFLESKRIASAHAPGNWYFRPHVWGGRFVGEEI
jgi:hypothetical protein